MAGSPNVSETSENFGMRWSLPVIVTLLLGGLASFIAFVAVAGLELRLASSNFRADAAARVRILDTQLRGYPEIIEGLRGHFESTIGDGNRKYFLLDAKRLFAQHPGIESLMWVKRVSESQRMASIRAARTSISAGFRFWERDANGKPVPARSRDVYYPIIFDASASSRPSLSGYDLGSNSKCLAALEADHLAGIAAIPCQVESDAKARNVALVTIARTIYREDEQDPRQINLKPTPVGYVIADLDVKKMIGEVFNDLAPRATSVSFFERGAGDAQRLLYSREKSLRAEPSAFSWIAMSNPILKYEDDVGFAGRKWHVVFIANRPLEFAHLPWNAYGTLAGGLLLTLMLTLYQIVSRQRAGQVRSAAGAMRTAMVELQRRDAILSAIAASAGALLRSSSPQDSLADVLGRVGNVSGASRLYIFRVHVDANRHTLVTRWFTWTAPGFEIPPGELQFTDVDMAALGLGSWIPRLSRGEVIAGRAREFGKSVRAVLKQTKALAIMVVPIFVNGKWWGHLAIDNCASERQWTSSEGDTIKTLAELIGSALSQQQSIAALSDANRIVENSSTILLRFGAEPSLPLLYLSRNTAPLGFSAEELIAAPEKWRDIVYRDDLPVILNKLQGVLTGQSERIYQDFRIVRSDGSIVWFQGQVSPVRDSAGQLTALEGLLTDITERKAGEEKLIAMARTDLLTNLPNRYAFMDRLRLEFAKSGRSGRRFAVLYLDLDYFKDINDTLGHAAGDMLLRAVGERLVANVNEGDLVARLGGDEFAVLRTDIDAAAAGALATSLLEACAAPFILPGDEVHLTVSIGVSLYDKAVAGPDEIATRADISLYRAKAAGRNRFSFHSEEIEKLVHERVVLAAQLRAALTDAKDLYLVYQPQVEMKSGRIVGVEALVRWAHPTRGLISPDVFIGAAETSGLIKPLGLWVLRQACDQMKRWRDEKIAPPVIAVNLSVVQLKLDGEFESVVGEIIAESGLNADDLELELTESTLMETTLEHRDVLAKLREKGARLSIDDFGTGYSSLDYLRSYAVNRIKIAQKFIDGIPDNPGDVAIVRATLGLARELGIEVIAEGVETATQADFLVAAGCRFVQGYYFSKPLTSDVVTALLRTGRVSLRGAAAIADEV